MPNWLEDPRRRNVYSDVYGQSLPMPGQTQPQGIPSLADLATLVNHQQPQQSGLPSPTFQQQQPAAPSLRQLQPPLMPQAAMSADTPASNQPKPAGFGRTLLDLGGGLVETARGLPAVVASQLEGVVNPGLERDWKDRVIEENRKRQQADIQALRDSGEYSRPMGLGIPMTRGEWAETTQSFPYTAATMGPAILGGIAGSAIGGAIGGLGGPAAPATVPAGVTAGRAIGSTLGGMLGAYIPAGRSAANQFIRDSIDQYQADFKEKNGREPSAEETGAYYKATIEPNAVRIYHGEAAPEAAGTVAELGLMKSAIGDILHGGGSIPVRAAKAAAKTALSAFVVEPGTETATQQIQQPAYAATGLTNEKPRSLSSVDDWLKSAGEVYKQAAATSLFFSALGIPAGSVYGRHLANQEGKARASDAEQATAELRTNLEFARESDIAEALSRFDEIENAGRLPKSAAQRIDAARQQLLGELSLRVSPESISAPLNSQRGMAGYLGFSERVNELDDAQLADLAGRALPENAEPTLADAAKRYQAEIGRRQALTDSAAHFEQNPDAVAGVAKTLDDIATGKPMSKGAHGSTAFNLASLSDDMLRRYQLAGEVLLRDHSEALGKQSTNVERSLSLLNEESQRRAEGQTRDPEAIREADLAERAAAEIAKGNKPNINGLSFETLDRMSSGLEARASLEPRLADSARMLREAAQQGRMRAFNPQGQQQPGIQSAMRGWNAGQTEDPAQPIDFTQDRARLSELAQQADVTSRQRAILDQEAQRRAIREQQRVARSQEIAALNQQNPPLATPQGLPTVTPSAIPQSLGQLGQTRLGNGVDQLPIPAQPQPSTPNVTESQGQGRPGQAPPMGLPARPTGASQSQARGTPEQAASALLRQVPGRLGEQARLNQERVRQQGWQAFGPDTGTLGIPRADMPQVKAEHRGALVNFLNARGVAHEQDEEVDPATLKPTQAEFSPKKVQQANEYQGGNRSILVSSDGHVVDGHHQWLSALSKGDPIKAIRLDAPIADLLPLVKEFPSSTESKTTTQPQPEQRREERQAEAAPLLSQEAEQNGNAKKQKAKGVAPTWNSANEIERAAMLSRSSDKAGAPVSNAFAQRKASEWKTWADIPEGPAKKRLRDYMADISRAENAPNRTESQRKEPDRKSDKKADIKPTKTSSKGASRNRAINATVDAGKDSLLTAIAKIGGLDRAEAQRQGIDLAEFKRMPVFGKPVFRKNGGKSFDAMAESLSEFGYPVLDEQGNYSPNVLLDAISRELAGNPVYTPQGIESAARRDAEEQAKFEQDNWLLDAIDLENAGFDALNDQEQVTAQLQAEASRDLGENVADTIFERISHQHEQANPEQFNEALGAAFNEARQRQSANSREQAGEPGSVQATDAILQDYSIEELRAEEERIAKAQSDQEAKDKAAQQKTAADRARSDFVLTGSNRPADVAMARGQTNLLGAMEGRPKTRQSKPSAAPTNTIQQARAQLIAALNDRSVAALERSGKLILHRTDPTRTGAAGYVDPQGAIHLIPSNMDQDALSVALHEAMHLARDDRFSEGNRAHIRLAHAALKITGLKNFIGNPGFSNLTQQLHRLAAEGNKTAIEALDKARREAPGNVEDEAMAYMVQYADENLPLVRRIIAALRAALYRMGIKVKLTPADVRALALSALKARAKDAALVQTARTQESFSLPEFAPTEDDKAEVERQMKAIKEILDGQGRLLAPNGKPSNLNERQWKQVRTKFFNDWFGDWENDPQNSSKVVDANGEPLVVYHGSPDARFISEDATFKSQKERYGFGGELGVHWFASSENTAKTYADVRRAFDYQSADPGVISAFLNIRDPIKIDAGGKKWRDAQKIGKTSDVIDQAQREERDGVIIDNVKDNYQTGVVKGDRPTTTFSVFRSAQIKSAIGNAGTFSARSNRIDYSQPTTETDAAEQDRLWQEFQAVRAQFQAKQASQSAFDHWFGKGVEGVNARNGKPLVLYHGTNNPEFNQWDESRSGQSSQHPTAGLGFFMTADKRSAARYGSRLLELHAKIDNPYFMTDADLVSIEDTQDAARFRRKLQAQGYDAAVISAPGGAPYVVALRSNQVKLASNDNPTESEDFRYSRPGGRQSPPAANPLPAETMGQAALRAVQDRFIRFQVVQDWLNQHGVNLTPDADVYGAESLLPKVTAARTQDAREKILKPLIESAAGKKWSIQGGDLLAAIEDQQPLPTKFKPSIPEFLHAQHAIERNAQIAKIKGAPKDGSGLNDAQAHEILTRYRVMPNFSEFSAMAEKFRTITDQTRRILRTSGIISAEQEAAWTSAYKKYVPLKGGPDTASQQNGTGPGISVNHGMKRALGHRLRDENIVENIWRDHERAIYLSEKQKVTRALRNMLEQANNQNIGTVGQPEKKATLHQGYYHQVWIDGNPLGAYGSYNEAKAAISSDAQQSGRSLSKYAVVHKPADPAVVFMSRPMLADNEVALYENGQRIRLQLNDELLARAARNLGVDGASGLLKAAQSFNRWLSHAYTGYNPEFILANVARDMTTGMINLSGQYGGKFALKALKGYGSAVRGLWKQIHGKADPWVDRYRAAGGSTGAAYLSDLERIGTDLKRTFQDYQGASETLRQGDRSGAARVAVSDKIRWLGGWIEKMNQVGENALRVATFRAMVEAGHSDAVAARAAGDVTVNFNRKGELTTTLGGLYLFFNPSIQGTKAMWDALAKGSHRGQAMALAGSLTLLALTLAELARGGDDADEEAWKRIPGYVKDRNLVIKMGDIQGTIPIPYGYGAFWSLGNILSDLSHGEDKTKAGIRFASSLFEQFSAIGNPFAGDEADIKNAVSLLPTALKPMMEIAMNRNSLGRPIMPEMSPWNTAQPDSARRWRSTTGSLYDGIASGLNSWTGGNAYQAGAIDISPETLSYLWRTFTGGAGKFAIDSMGLGARIAQGVSPELREIPVLRKFVRAESIQDARALFNEQSATVRLAVDAFNAAKRAKDLPAMRQMLDEQREILTLGKVLRTAQKMIRVRRELEDRINQSDLSIEEKRAQLKTIEKQESSILSRFTARFEKAKQESR
jgi:hypothetical protein